MSDERAELPKLVQNLAERAGKVKLANGLVGKMTQVAITVIIGLSAVACATKSPVIEGICVGVILVSVLFIVYKSLSFAEKNPATALLEGAEFIEYQKVLQDTKYPSPIDDTESIIIINDPVSVSATQSIEDSEMPDEVAKDANVSNGNPDGKESKND